MTDTKEFNKSLDRIAKALGGEEWSPEDKPEAIYKLLDKIADKLEEGAGGGSTSDIMYVDITSTYDETTSTEIYSATKTYNEIREAIDSGKAVYARYLTSSNKPCMALLQDYSTYENPSQTFFTFCCTVFVGDYQDGYFIDGYNAKIYADGEVTYEYAEKAFYP